MTKFAKHPDEMWRYEKVHPDNLQKIDAVGFAFENVEVFSIDIEAVESIFFDNYSSNHYYEDYLAKNRNALMTMKTVEFFRIRLSKETLETEKHVCLNGMFGDTDEESVEYLKNHFEYPDLVAITLFDFENKQMVDFYIPWVGDDDYHNEGVKITEEKTSIKIIAKSKNYDKM